MYVTSTSIVHIVLRQQYNNAALLYELLGFDLGRSKVKVLPESATSPVIVVFPPRSVPEYFI